MKKLLVCVLSMVILLSACGDSAEYIATVGDSKVSVGELEFYLDSVKSQMAGTELTSDEDWNTKEIEGRKAIELAKEKALEGAINNLSLIEVGKALDIKLTKEDKEDVSSIKNQFINQFGGKDGYKEFLKTNNIDDDFIDVLCNAMKYEMKLIQKITEEEPVPDEEVTEYFEANKEQLSSQYRHAKHILILTKNMETGVALSEDELAKAKEKADDILKRAKQGEDFDALAKEFSQDPGLATQPDGYVFTDGEMVLEFQTEVDRLKPGEIGFTESDFGYHIILRLPLEKDDVAKNIASVLLYEKLDKKIDEWVEENNIEIVVNDELLSTIK